MNFNTSNSTFRQLLGNGLTYCVPPFQRDYSWTEAEWEELWTDILCMIDDNEEPAHYMGYLVLQSSDNKRFDIIDGQQRITTISILILAGIAHLKGLAEANIDADNNRLRKEKLLESYIGYVDPVSLLSHSKLELNRHNNRYYQSYLITLESLPQRGLNRSEHQLRRSFQWFYDKIKARIGMKVQSGQEAAKFIDTLVDRLFFTVITVTDELNAFKVFETLNARGVRLSSTDLLKNYLFSMISGVTVHENELKRIEDTWERIIGLLGSESFPEFLRVFWNSSHKLVRKSELFKIIKRHISSREEVFRLVRELDFGAGVYATLRDAQDSLWSPEERQNLALLSMFGVRQPLALLMAAYHCFFEKERAVFTRILRSIAVISFRYNVICNFQPNEQEYLYNNISCRISDGSYSNIYDVLQALKAIYPDDAQFKTSFTNKELRTANSRNKKIMRYILHAMEKQKSGHDFDFESSAYNIEHILPENPSDDWIHFSEEHQEQSIYRIGNMCLLESGSNRNIGNGSFSQKKEAYAESDFILTRAVSEHYETWTESTIAARQKKLADLAAGIWRIDFGA
jgi:hypothetical protein